MTRVRIWARSRTESPPSDAIAASIAALVAPPLNFTRMSSRSLAGAAAGLELGAAVGAGEGDASTPVGACDGKSPSRAGAGTPRGGARGVEGGEGTQRGNARPGAR